MLSTPIGIPNMPWPLAWLIIQLLNTLWHVTPHGVTCQWEYHTRFLMEHGHKVITSIGFVYGCFRQ